MRPFPGQSMTRFAREPSRVTQPSTLFLLARRAEGHRLLGRQAVGVRRGRGDSLVAPQALAQVGVAQSDVPGEGVPAALLVPGEVVALRGLGGRRDAGDRREGEEEEENRAKDGGEAGTHEAEVSRSADFPRGGRTSGRTGHRPDRRSSRRPELQAREKRGGPSRRRLS